MEWKNLADDKKYDSIKEELKVWLPKHNAKDSKKVVWPGDKPGKDGENEIESE